MLLQNKTAIITGAASLRGLGLAAARLFIDHGAHVAVVDLDRQATQHAVAALEDNNSGDTPRAIGIGCDVTDRQACLEAVAKTLQAFGQVDILVNIAGITSPERLMQVTDTSYNAVMDVNMKGTLHMTQAVVPHMRERGHGAIVNMSSVSAQRGGGVFGGSHYSAAKAAILGYTKAAARELGPDNIRVNAICPSFIDTDITAGMMTPAQLEQVIASVPMGRPGHAHEVAGCVLFLASDLASYVTGSEIDINGGSHIH
ncbi:MAG: SDR family NAD(P)-dependent oxidoreductase [Burkholderiaceae bacterium]